MPEPKKLILYTSLIAIALFLGATFHVHRQANLAVSFEVDGFPTEGKASAPIEIVLIEDFQCRNCRVFSQKIIPKLQSQYIASGKARFTLVPVSFLAGAQALANAALEVHRQRPDLFFSYLKAILHEEEEVENSTLLRSARRLGGIDLERLQTCIETGCHRQTLLSNLNWAKNLMGAQFKTPAIYINGVPGSTYSFEAIAAQIEHLLRSP